MRFRISICIIMVHILSLTVDAQQGYLDPTFGNGGYLQINGIGPMNAITIQPDDKIITVGPTFTSPNQGFSITRSLPNGPLDNSFSGDGILVIQPLIPNTEIVATPYAAAVLPDGRIVVVGDRYDRMDPFPPGSPIVENYFTMISWVNPDGSVASIGTYDLSPGKIYEGAYGIDVQSDGKVVVTGEAFNSATGLRSMVVMRFNSNGTLDNSFDGDGILYTNFQGQSRGYGVEVQLDGKIVLSGQVESTTGGFDFVIVRLTSSGAYDNSFDTDGKKVITVGVPFRNPVDLELTPDGKYIVAGAISASSSQVFKLDANGGVVTGPDFVAPILPGLVHSVIVQADGKIILGSNNVMRLLPNGSLDPSFGNGGIANLGALAALYPFFRDIGMQSSGRIIAGDSQGPRLLAGIINSAVDCSGSNSPIGLIPDVYSFAASNVANSIYIGYGSQSLTLTVQASQGTTPYQYIWSTGSQSSSTIVNPSTPGFYHYTVTIIDSKGCSTSVSKQITVIDVRCGNKNDKVEICHGNKMNCVSANAIPALLKNGGLLGHCTENISRAANENLIETQPGLLVVASPNPSTSFFLVSVQSKRLQDKIVLTVYDVTGKQIDTKTVTAGIPVRVGELLPGGIYLIKAQQGEKSSHLKLIKTN